jgi:hypothetical protein
MTPENIKAGFCATPNFTYVPDILPPEYYAPNVVISGRKTREF